ncbi:hypothetical protein N7471_002774 [Penicillium samsonianum]|uniref:uncharacterized protein n=1 Tax=Penicillium samsonianum TaxID=1882272 RepID=UPI0025472B29|nr:uncharacterized protein N7471_002774 [Penicillium samsonianum]KAJ6143321.1 hypothetical protein N7471_002774 [Penicillium samsonianum]
MAFPLLDSPHSSSILPRSSHQSQSEPILADIPLNLSPLAVKSKSNAGLRPFGVDFGVGLLTHYMANHIGGLRWGAVIRMAVSH